MVMTIIIVVLCGLNGFSAVFLSIRYDSDYSIPNDKGSAHILNCI